MCEFRYDYVKLKYGEKVKVCYMDKDISYIKKTFQTFHLIHKNR